MITSNDKICIEYNKGQNEYLVRSAGTLYNLEDKVHVGKTYAGSKWMAFREFIDNSKYYFLDAIFGRQKTYFSHTNFNYAYSKAKDKIAFLHSLTYLDYAKSRSYQDDSPLSAIFAEQCVYTNFEDFKRDFNHASSLEVFLDFVFGPTAIQKLQKLIDNFMVNRGKKPQAIILSSEDYNRIIKNYSECLERKFAQVDPDAHVRSGEFWIFQDIPIYSERDCLTKENIFMCERKSFAERNYEENI